MIRTSSHPLPIEYFRRKGLSKEQRLCNLCDTNVIGSEMHLLATCDNQELIILREKLVTVLHELNPQWKKFNIAQKMNLLLLANV